MKKWMSAIVVAVLLMAAVLTGCQPIQGVDLNKAMLADFEMKTFEGKSSLSLNIDYDPDKVSDPEALEILQLLSQTALHFNEVKKENDREISLKGAFEYAKGEIPFTAYIDAYSHIAFDTEGAKKPFVLKSFGDVPESEKEMMEAITEVLPELEKMIATFLVNNLPNPEHLDLTSESVEIGGTKTTLKKVHAEIGADEVYDLVHQFVHSLKEDKQGLEQTISDVYDLLFPVIKKLAEEQSNPGAAMMLGQMEKKDQAVQMAVNGIMSVLEGLDAQMEAALENGETGIEEIVDESSKLTMDIYLDSMLFPRKTDVGLHIVPPKGKDEGIHGIRLNMSQELWNVNGAVTADEIDIGDDPFIIDESTEAREFLQNLETDAPLYQLLKNDLHITRKTLELTLNNTDQHDPEKPYISNGYTLVPARYVVENLDAEIDWNQEKRQVTIFDERTGTEIVLTIGSDIATVNGREVKLETKTELKNGTTFVPLRFIVESIQGEVKWDPDTRTITIIVE